MASALSMSKSVRTVKSKFLAFWKLRGRCWFLDNQVMGICNAALCGSVGYGPSGWLSQGPTYRNWDFWSGVGICITRLTAVRFPGVDRLWVVCKVEV